MLSITKRIFAEAICNLSKTKPIDKITVNEIVKYSNAGRQTFYYHFKDKYDLIRWMYQENVNQFFKLCDSNESFRGDMQKIYQHFAYNKQFYTKLIKMDGQESFMSIVFDNSCAFYKKSIVERFGQEELTDDLTFTIELSCYGHINMLKKWILSDMKIPPEKMADNIIDNLPNNLRKYFK